MKLTSFTRLSRQGRWAVVGTGLWLGLLCVASPLLRPGPSAVPAEEPPGESAGAVDRFVQICLSASPQPVGPLLTLELDDRGRAQNPVSTPASTPANKPANKPAIETQDSRNRAESQAERKLEDPEEGGLLGGRVPLPAPPDIAWKAFLHHIAAAVKLFVKIALQVIQSFITGLV